MKIISASRRTDIPAFYGEWLMNRIAEGFAGYVNPFNNKKYIVSFKKEDVAAVVLWSKNFIPFQDNLLYLKEKGYTLFFNYTITSLPDIFEPGAPSSDETVESLKFLSSRFSPDHINWRYDPVLVSDITEHDYHLDRFEKLCRSLSGHVNRCYISFPTPYGKVERSLADFKTKTGITIHSPYIEEKISMGKSLSSVAYRYNIKIYSCCGDYLTGDTIGKGHCIDGQILSSLSTADLLPLKVKPTRKECGCTESTDIGIYDSCPHGCVYCYANSNITRAASFYQQYKSDSSCLKSVFLGVTKETSDMWMEQIHEKENNHESENTIQPLLF